MAHKKIARLRGIYAIVDPSGRPGFDPVALSEAAIRAGVAVLQLRAKDLSARELVQQAKAMAGRCREAGVIFIVNDRLDAALAAGADGVHLGQDDLPLDAARRVAGKDFLIGISTHSVAEAAAAEQAGADYIGFGAMYSTASKKDVTPPQGPGLLAEVVRAVSIPAIAIGGIALDKLAEVHAAGAKGAAVIGAWTLAADPETALRGLVERWRKLDKRNNRL